ncbi:response regulator [Pseudoalteromonas sp. C2R02]|uniref:response regulator n=1 Tax=Pseudoalteromonas sp. C2R02 TaxID=2841565 RepID=UPI001C09D809|nr:response regulator [Pseudoalteromonas sp. C2R02]MBU2969150.1 response regulator [Pseudoalteromonas sp. C2R02]
MSISALVVEDDICLNDLIALSLGDGYLIDKAFSVKQASELILEKNYDVVLLDYYLPDGVGIDIANCLKSQNTLPIIVFISASDDLDIKMAAFNSGAIEWIDKKSFQPAILTHKIDVALKVKNSFDAIRQAEKSSNEVVFAAMSDSFVWGTTAKAIQSSLLSRNINSFINTIFKYFNDLDLIASIAINENQHLSFWDSPTDGATGMEEDLLKLAMQTGKRVLNVGRRYFIQTENLSFLIKNIPEDEVKKGQLLDVLAAFIECAESQLNALNKDKVKQLYFCKIESELNQIKKQMKNFTAETNRIHTEQSLIFFEIFSQLQLTDEEELNLTEVTEKTLLKFEQMADSHLNIISSLDDVMQDFQKQLK